MGKIIIKDGLTNEYFSDRAVNIEGRRT